MTGMTTKTTNMLMMEMCSYSTLKSFLSTVPVKALNYSSRLKLANNLNCKQILQSQKGFARDYRGLAEQIGVSYHTIKMFEEFEDCTMKILEAWETRPDATLDKLISYLENMECYDVIENLMPSLKKNVEIYLNSENANQDSEECCIYDAYVSYADEDKAIVTELAKKLESPRVRLKLYIRERDMVNEFLMTDISIESEFIKNRCRLILIVLTPNYLKSPEFKFLVDFASCLNTAQKQNALIPVILEHCEVPPLLNDVSKFDLSKESTQVLRDRMLEDLIISLLPKCQLTMFLPSENCTDIPNENNSDAFVPSSNTSFNVIRSTEIYENMYSLAIK